MACNSGTFTHVLQFAHWVSNFQILRSLISSHFLKTLYRGMSSSDNMNYEIMPAKTIAVFCLLYTLIAVISFTSKCFIFSIRKLVEYGHYKREETANEQETDSEESSSEDTEETEPSYYTPRTYPGARRRLRSNCKINCKN